MRWPFRSKAKPATPQPSTADPGRKRKPGISDMALINVGRNDRFELTPIRPAPPIAEPFAIPPRPKDVPGVAMDDAATNLLGGYLGVGFNFGEGIGFLGYQYLAELAQRAEYRRGSEVLAREMTRRWIEFKYVGEDDANTEEDEEEPGDGGQPPPPFGQSDDPPPTEGQGDPPANLNGGPTPGAADPEPEPDDIGTDPLDEGPKLKTRKPKPSDLKIQAIEAEFDRLRVRDAFRRAAELDGFFGRGHIYIDTGHSDEPDELRTPLLMDKRKIRKNGIKRLLVIEPQWMYPGVYNSRDPLKKEFFTPQSWLVMAKDVHASRMLTFVGREVPDMLKPAYSFGGLSLTQMAKPYVDNWLRTRQSVSDLIHSFTVWGIKTDLGALLSGADDGDSMIKRAQIFNQARDNRGVAMLDKETEEFFNLSVPLGSLDKLQAQAQEQMASVFAIPLVVLLGVTPSGLNASSDGEIRVFYDFIAAFQQHLFKHQLEKLVKMVQLSLFREIDEDITFEFLPLWQPTDSDKATIAKSDADLDKTYIDAGVLDPVEVRQKIANDKDSPYSFIDVDNVPEPPTPPGGGMFGGDPNDPFGGGDDAPTGPPGGGDPPAGVKAPPPGGRMPGQPPKAPAQDAEPQFKEADHPRDKDGRFGSGGGHTSQAREAPEWHPSPVGHLDTSHLPTSKDVRQPFKTWKQAEAMGNVGRQQLESALTEVAQKIGLSNELETPDHLTREHETNGQGYVFMGPNKTQAKATAKVDNDYGGNWGQLKDMVRATIAVEHPDDLKTAIDQVLASGIEFAAQPKDNVSKATGAGYRDINTLVKLPNGMFAELQFNVKSMVVAKTVAHQLYNEQLLIEQKNPGVHRSEWPEEDQENFEQLNRAQQVFYDAAWMRSVKSRPSAT